MPKFLVGLISTAFALVIGFACGATLTAPQNSQMEKVVNEKKAMKETVTNLEQQIQSLKSDVKMLQGQNQQLKDRLLRAYQEKENNEARNNVPVYPK